MMTNTEEYLPSETEPPAPAAGPPPRKKIFTLAPAEDDLTSAILAARMRVATNRKLSRPARLMYVILLDLSLRRTSNVSPGVVRLSDTKLSEYLDANRRTIWRWKDELVRSGDLWLSHHPMPNTWPLTIYHLSAIAPRSPFSDQTTSEGIWGNGSRRLTPQAEHEAKIARSQKCHSDIPDIAEAKNADLLGNSPATPRECPPSGRGTAACQASPPRPARRHHRGLPSVTTAACQASPPRPAKRHHRGLPSVTTAALKEAQDRGKDVQEDQEKDSLSVQRGSTPKRAGKERTAKALHAEREFLADVSDTLNRWRKGSGKAELENSGAWWRMAFRSDANLIRKVLAETLRAIKESQIKTNPGAYAVDLWKRWGGKIESEP